MGGAKCPARARIPLLCTSRVLVREIEIYFPIYSNQTNAILKIYITF